MLTSTPAITSTKMREVMMMKESNVGFMPRKKINLISNSNRVVKETLRCNVYNNHLCSLVVYDQFRSMYYIGLLVIDSMFDIIQTTHRINYQ